MSEKKVEAPERKVYDLAYAIVEQMGLGLEFRNCRCGQFPCARLRPIVDALAKREAEVSADLLHQPRSERCGECGHGRDNLRDGICHMAVWPKDKPGKMAGYPCGCKCVFPATGAPMIEKAAELADEYARRLRSINNHAVAAGVEVLAKEIRELAVATTGAGAGTERTATSVSVLMGYEAALREVNECEKCDLCEDHLPATIAEGEPQRCGAFKPSVLGVPEPQNQCTLPDGHEGKHTLAAPAPVQPVAAGQGDVEDLHLAICQAVALMNQGDLHGGHDLLRQTLVDFADKKAPLSRSEIVRQQQRTGGGEVTAVMISPSTSTPGEGAREIETRLGVLPLSLIDDIDGRRESIYHGWNYQLDAKVASQMKTDLDYLRAFVGALLSRHFPPTEATQPAFSEEEAKETARKILVSEGLTGDVFPVVLGARLIDAVATALLKVNLAPADAGEVERLMVKVKEQQDYIASVSRVAQSWLLDKSADMLPHDLVMLLGQRLDDARANAIRDSRDAIAGALRAVKETYIPVNRALEISVTTLESLTKKSGDDGPTRDK